MKKSITGSNPSRPGVRALVNYLRERTKVLNNLKTVVVTVSEAGDITDETVLESGVIGIETNSGPGLQGTLYVGNKQTNTWTAVAINHDPPI